MNNEAWTASWLEGPTTKLSNVNLAFKLHCWKKEFFGSSPIVWMLDWISSWLINDIE